MGKIIKVTKEIAAARLASVPAEKVFWCRDGGVLRNLKELETALTKMSEVTFRHHSNEAKSDFANWVGDVIGDQKLARDLRKSATQEQALRCVSSRVAWLRSRMV